MNFRIPNISKLPPEIRIALEHIQKGQLDTSNKIDNKVTVSDTEPESPGTGDVWIDISSGESAVVVRVWDGSKWVAAGSISIEQLQGYLAYSQLNEELANKILQAGRSSAYHFYGDVSLDPNNHQVLNVKPLPTESAIYVKLYDPNSINNEAIYYFGNTTYSFDFTGSNPGVYYIYFDLNQMQILRTTDIAAAYADMCGLIAVVSKAQATNQTLGVVAVTQKPQVYVNSDLITSNAILASHIEAGAITADKIAAGAVTADKMSVAELSAITADLGTVNAGKLYIPIVPGISHSIYVEEFYEDPPSEKWSKYGDVYHLTQGYETGYKIGGSQFSWGQLRFYARTCSPSAPTTITVYFKVFGDVDLDGLGKIYLGVEGDSEMVYERNYTYDSISDTYSITLTTNTPQTALITITAQVGDTLDPDPYFFITRFEATNISYGDVMFMVGEIEGIGSGIYIYDNSLGFVGGSLITIDKDGIHAGALNGVVPVLGNLSVDGNINYSGKIKLPVMYMRPTVDVAKISEGTARSGWRKFADDIEFSNGGFSKLTIQGVNNDDGLIIDAFLMARVGTVSGEDCTLALTIWDETNNIIIAGTQIVGIADNKTGFVKLTELVNSPSATGNYDIGIYPMVWTAGTTQVELHVKDQTGLIGTHYTSLTVVSYNSGG